MSDDFDDANQDSDSEGIKSLRKQYEESQKELKALREERDQRSAAERTTKVKELLKAKGVPESAAKFFSGDDASEDAVGKWIDENADIFRPAAAQADPNAAAADRVSAASHGSYEPTSQQTSRDGSGRVLGDPAEIARLLATQPYEELVKLGIMPDPKNDMYRRPVV